MALENYVPAEGKNQPDSGFLCLPGQQIYVVEVVSIIVKDLGFPQNQVHPALTRDRLNPVST